MKLEHEDYMRRVIELAKKGEGKTSPNPLVGCLIEKDGKILAEDYHRAYGDYHAERNALNTLLAGSHQDLSDATLYVNLEPCCHYGKTPPCTEIIIESGIKNVVVGLEDKNKKVNGKGLAQLREHGIHVITGVLEKECMELNEIFYHFIENQKPFVLMKYAMTMDGRIASYTGHSRWISSEEARINAHKSRNKYRAIMVGIGTVLKDDPMLNCRIPEGRDPIRIVCDSKLRIPLDSKILKTCGEIDSIIATCSKDKDKIKIIEEMGAKVLVVEERESKVDLNELMIRLGQMDIDSILLEGGAELNFSALESKIVNKVHTYLAPKIIGSNRALSPVGGLGIADVNKAFLLHPKKITNFGSDLLIESEVDYSCLQES